ncbi:MAG: EamA family transporter [Hyphomicrobium sp.]|nr:EamA family transporter [Hyphomicrobium sp.]
MPSTPALSLRDALLAVAIMAVWGSNFSVVSVVLADGMPPLLFASLRFTFAVLPAIFFLPRPNVPWSKFAAYGLLIGVGQFGLLFLAMRGHITPGLASLIAQTQVFFTIAMAVAISGERVRPFQVLAVLLAATGVAVIISHTDGSTTPYGLALVIIAAVAWAGANMVTRTLPGINMVSFIVWASLFSAPPLFALSLWVEGWPAIRDSLANAGLQTWAAVAYQSFGNTLFGFAMWGWLLARYPAATIAPMSLLVPVFGMGIAALWLSEPLPPWKMVAAALVMAGLAVNILWPRVAAIRGARNAPAA